MKQLLRSFFSPILNIFEQGEEEYVYKPLNRKILIFMGLIFAGLTVLIITFIPEEVGISAFIPVIVFGLVTLVTLVVGLLGNERAVTKIWGDR
jgi:drug/metabolite transporter (DMT)-like permease